MVRIFSKYDNVYPQDYVRGETPEIDCVCFVDDVGYVPMESQIRQLMNAGIRLEEYRRSQYDFQFDCEVDIDSAIVSPENDLTFDVTTDLSRVVDQLVGVQQKREATADLSAHSDQAGKIADSVGSNVADSVGSNVADSVGSSIDS